MRNVEYNVELAVMQFRFFLELFTLFQITLVALMIAYVSAKPQLYSPLVTAPVANGALISRTFHGNTSPYVAALPYTAPSAPIVAVASPYFAAYSQSVLLR